MEPTRADIASSRFPRSSSSSSCATFRANYSSFSRSSYSYTSRSFSFYSQCRFACSSRYSWKFFSIFSTCSR